MNKWLILFLAGGLIFFAFRKKAPPSAPSFHGRWKLTQMNKVSETGEQRECNVWSDGENLRIDCQVEEQSVMRTSEMDTVVIFDGTNLHEKTVYPPPPPGESDRFAGEPETSTRKASPAEVKSLRFWLKARSGDGEPGGKIAGRETVLYQTRDERGDARVTDQAWLDAETKVVLRSRFSLFSKQVEAALDERTEECLEIHYGPQETGVFAKP